MGREKGTINLHVKEKEAMAWVLKKMSRRVNYICETARTIIHCVFLGNECGLG
jgi:hypothetical protein